MTKLPLHTANKADDNFKKLAELFPNAVTETLVDGVVTRGIDKDILTQEISAHVVEGNEERYQFTWPDKKKSVLLANAPNYKTLRPCKEESVDFDTTENLYIEGDNLDVLKLLQETYLGKVKMIYIDPPYNTGKDFVYADDFRQSVDEYMDLTDQYDEDGNRLFTNSETNGRYHTDWLNMIYPRLRLAKDLLKDDGVIFISIDDNEVENLKKVCNEIFGSWNFVCQFVWAAGRKNDSKFVSISHEYILCYTKSLITLKEQKVEWRERKQGLDEIYAIYNKLKKQYCNDYKKIQSEIKIWYKSLPSTHPANNHSHYNCIDSRGIYFPDNISWPGGGGPKYEVLHPITKKPVKIPSRGWMFSSLQRMQELIDDNRVHFGDDENGVPCIKSYLSDREYSAPYSVFYKDGRASTKRLRTLMGAMVFENPKDEEIVVSLLEFTLTKDSIILDFFSGSATTAHAVMQLNAKDGGNRKFIMVQLPEEIDEKHEAYKAGYRTICDIGKERIRRAGEKIKDEKGLDAQNLDIGFRVLKCDSTNMKDVYYSPNDVEQTQLDLFTDNIKDDRTPEDLLFQVMLDLGVFLSCKIETEVIDGKNIFVVYQGSETYLIACFDSKVSMDVVTAIAKRKPYYAVFRDSSMASDSLMASFEQIFEAYSKDTIRKVL